MLNVPCGVPLTQTRSSLATRHHKQYHPAPRSVTRAAYSYGAFARDKTQRTQEPELIFICSGTSLTLQPQENQTKTGSSTNFLCAERACLLESALRETKI